MRRDALHNRIIREIIARVASAAYAPRTRLPAERALCAEFGVARGTLRKALAQLERLGVVRIRHGSGVYVQGLVCSGLPPRVLPPDFKTVGLPDIIEARRAIELAAVRRSASRITAGQLRTLARLVHGMARATDNLARFLALDLTFHDTLVRAGGNPVLTAAHEAIREYERLSMVYTTRRAGEEQRALAQHRRLLQALERRDVAASRRILKQHLDNVQKHSGPAPGRRSAVQARA